MKGLKMNDVWPTRYNTYATRVFRTPSGLAKAVSRFSKNKDIESVDFTRILDDETNEFGWVGTIVVDES